MYDGLISYCIPCRGRLEHLRRTLPSNLSATDERSEFVVVNYGDTEGLDEWMKAEGYATDPRVKYVKVEAERFRFAHSKNVAVRNAQGEFVVSLDADNFLGWETDTKLRELLNMIAGRLKLYVSCHQLPGCIGAYKSQFDALGGYDEDLPLGDGWGAEDYDLRRRLEACGCLHRVISDIEATYLEHSDDERVKHTGQDVATFKSVQPIFKHVEERIKAGRIVANEGKEWGKTHE